MTLTNLSRSFFNACKAGALPLSYGPSRVFLTFLLKMLVVSFILAVFLIFSYLPFIFRNKFPQIL